MQNSAGTDLFNARDLGRIENLELLASRFVEGLISGRHRSKLKGGSAEFAEHRGYVAGDEIRLIDWKVAAKRDRFFIRQYIEQTCLQVIFALDVSGSMGFGIGSPSKFYYARAAAACLTRLVLLQNDSAGVAMIGETLREYIPPRSNPRHFQSILKRLGNHQPDGRTGIAEGLIDLARRIKRRGLIVLLSDCFDELNALERALHFLHARGHETILLHVMAPEELDFHFEGWSQFECLELEGQRIELEPAMVRQEYLENVRIFLRDLKQLCAKTGCDYHPLPCGEPLGESLARYLAGRSARLKTP